MASDGKGSAQGWFKRYALAFIAAGIVIFELASAHHKGVEPDWLVVGLAGAALLFVVIIRWGMKI